MSAEYAPLDSIVILYRQPDVMSLWGIPYRMRADVGQQPRDLERADNRKGWIYLGTCGWWGDLSRERQEEIKAFLAPLADLIPQGPCEWTEIK